MKILITSILDIKKAPPNRIHHFVKFLSKNHEIKIVCINDWWRKKQDNSDKYYKDFKLAHGSIDIQYFTQKNLSPIIQEFLSPILLNKFEKDFDIIFNYNTLISGQFIAKKTGCPMVYDLADDLPEMIGNSPQIPVCLRTVGKNIGERALKNNILLSKKITGTSIALKNSYNIPQDKFELIPNGVYTSVFKKMETDLKQELKLDGFFVLGFVGVLREWVDLDPVYKALKKLDSVKLIIIGEEGNLDANKKLVKDYNIEDKVIFTGIIPYSQIPKYISVMDACLIPFDQNAISQNAVPLKLFEYMACEKPVISTRLRGVDEVVGHRILYANTPEEYISQINSIRNGEFSESDCKDWRKFIVDRYDWDTISSKVEKILADHCL